MSKKLESRVDTLYVYRRLHECLGGDNEDHERWETRQRRLPFHRHRVVCYDVSRLLDELADNFYTDTGVKVGQALGWDKKAKVRFRPKEDLWDKKLVPIQMPFPEEAP